MRRSCVFVLLALAFHFSNLRAVEELEFRLYDVTDLITETDDHPGPSLELAWRNPDGTPATPFSGTPPRAHGCGSIQEWVKTRIRPDKWDPNTGVSIEERGGRLAIVQTAAMHELIAALFATFREDGLVQVGVKTLLVPSETLPRETIFTNDALTKWLGPKGFARALAAPRIVCTNNQRTSATCVRSYGYIADMEISGDMFDPVIRACLEGSVLDVKPILSHDRRMTTIDLRFTLSSNAVLSENSKITFALPLAEERAKKTDAPSFPIDTVKLGLGSVRTTVRVPAGCWVFAGTIANPDKASKEKELLLFVAAEPTDKKLPAAPNAPLAPAVKNAAFPAPPPAPKNAAFAPGEPVLRIYDVHDLCGDATDFPFSFLGDFMNPSVDPFSTAPSHTGIADTDLAMLIKDKILAAQFADPQFTMDVSNVKLVFSQVPEVHNYIARILDAFRKNLTQKVAVRTYLVSVPDLPDETLFDEAAVNALLAKEGNEIVASTRFVCFNNQLAHVKKGSEIAYVKDYDVSGLAYDPVVSSVFDGVRVEARPIVSVESAATVLQFGFGFNSDVTKTKRTLGLAHDAGATLKGALPAKESASLLGGQNISGCELETVTMNTSVLQTQLIIPNGKWVLAGTFSSGNPKIPRTTLLLVSAETVAEPKNP